MSVMKKALPSLIVLASLGGCRAESNRSPSSPPTPAPTPTPEPAGAIRLLDSSLPPGSTVDVHPMHRFGQQAPDLRFWAAVNLREGLDEALVQAFVRTDEHRCMGGGQAGVDLPAGEETLAAPLSMSHQANPLPPCTLPYTTTHVEFVVVDSATQEVVLEARFPAVYDFVAAP